jgi:cyanophycin synthetase
MISRSDDARASVTVSEVRVLDGPNLYFTRPAIKVSLQLPGYLEAQEETLRRLAGTLELRRVRPGSPGSEQRQRFVLRLVERVVRRIASAGGTTRLGVRARPASARDEVVVAFPWHHRGRGEALGECLGEVLTRLLGEDGGAALDEAAARLREVAPGEAPRVVRPAVPVASITGTNGKTTTTRLLAHLGMTAGLRTAWSSTDGVLVQGELVEAGDYSGPAGARAVLASPGVELGILETARGGMLLRGMGVSSNDVSVVTNVSADHLGLQGIDTVDQLAEVKAIVTKVTRPDGWVVLNGDDPRVWAMAAGFRARTWAFSLDPDSPALRQSLSRGGRGTTVMDGDIVTLTPGGDPDHLARVIDVPVTLSGLSEHNVANALAATAAGLGLGLPRAAVVRGLLTFAPDPRQNPGRMNVYSLPLASGGSVSVIIDLAHNEAGLEALLRVADGLRPPGSYVHLGLGTGGDRTDEILVNLGELAGRRADLVQIVHKVHYLRGRTMDDLEERLREGLANVGMTPTHSWPTELHGLQGLLAAAEDGDVVAVMCHADRALLDGWLVEHGATPDGPAEIRHKVIVARGEHELQAEIDALEDEPDEQAAVAAARSLVDTHPGDPRLDYELGGCLDRAGKEEEAIGWYRKAIDAGLREPHRHRALIQLASSLRVVGRPEDALRILDDLATYRPSSVAVEAFRALARHDGGDHGGALAGLLTFVVDHATDPEDQAYARALRAYAAQLTPTPPPCGSS